MPKTATGVKTEKAGGIGAAAVQAKTGRTWDEWFALLDKAGAADMSHKQIASHLHERCGVPAWWSQMVTVGYEQERLGRRKHEKARGGFDVSSSKTVNVPVGSLYRAWSDKRSRRRWLDADEAGFHVRKSTADKSMRITWIDETTSVEVNFADKGPAKSRVQVQHSKLKSAAAAQKAKAAWKERLARLKEVLEG